MPRLPLTDVTVTISIPKILTTGETLKTFRISRATLMEGVDRNELEVMRPNGKSFLFNAEDVFAWLKKRHAYRSYRPSIH